MNSARASLLQEMEGSIHQDDCLWSGRPSLLPYLLVNRRLFGVLVATVVLFWYLDFKWFFITQIWTASSLVYLLFAMYRWTQLAYFITPHGPVIKRGKRWYQMRWENISKDAYRYYISPIEMIWNRRTLEYGRYYKVATGRFDSWREKARFWCIKDHKLVDSIFREYMSLIQK